MEVITGNEVLEKRLLSAIAHYDHFAFASAWASAGTKMFMAIRRHGAKLRYGVIGTHFYQTDPAVLDAYVASRTVKFILRPSGVFHPKILVFWSRRGFDVYIGSANLTKGAFGANAEAVVRITQADDPAATAKTQVVEAIRGYFDEASTLTAEAAAAYREQWRRKRPQREQLEGSYGGKSGSKPPVELAIMRMDFAGYLAALRQDRWFRDRLQVLAMMRSAFARHQQFHDMDEQLRRAVAGLPNDRIEHWGLFGSMRGAGKFYAPVDQHSSSLSQALAAIPEQGLVPESAYRQFLKGYRRAFPEGRHGIGTATRLLAMKRPDQFVCFNQRDRAGLCTAFGILKTGMNYERYWDELIQRIRDCAWWNAPRPAGREAKAVWDGRAAMLDALYYHAPRS